MLGFPRSPFVGLFLRFANYVPTILGWKLVPDHHHCVEVAWFHPEDSFANANVACHRVFAAFSREKSSRRAHSVSARYHITFSKGGSHQLKNVLRMRHLPVSEGLTSQAHSCPIRDTLGMFCCRVHVCVPSWYIRTIIRTLCQFIAST